MLAKTLNKRLQQERELLHAYDLAAARKSIRYTHKHAIASFGENSVECAGCLLNLGIWHELSGEYAAAEPLLKQAEQIFRQHLPAPHPEIATAHFYQARVLYRQAKFDEAVQAFWQVLVQYQEAYFPQTDHVDIARTIQWQAYSQMQLKNQQEQGLSNQEKAAAMFERLLGMNHAETAMAYTYVAEWYMRGEHRLHGLSVLQHTLPTVQQHAGSLHPDTAYVATQLAICEDVSGLHDKAREHFALAKHIYEQSVGEQHPLYAEFLIGFAEHHAVHGYVEQALRYYHQALEIFTACMDEDFIGIPFVIKRIAMLMMRHLADEESSSENE
ncbi:tetratricopeptide repeat protein [Kingella kingae]|uniref:tetratricopeptide repeat protein n=1 Tax=Kingella kingae TaxID=504 RepID=UPI002550E17F|nr:tetratricopeptide repeat protein [Kingella kingae]MDK4612432.1 tetratricopeptide repeat protein [Kingella kingae]